LSQNSRTLPSTSNGSSSRNPPMIFSKSAPTVHALTRMAEEQQLYLYVGDLRFSNLLFPVVYLPLIISQDEQSGEFHLELDSHLYVNKRAIDHVAQELGVSVALQTLHSVADRILYLDPGVAPIGEIERIFGKLQSLFGLDRAQSSKVRLSTASYLAVFDRSDEALLNDYEALLAQLRSEPDSIRFLSGALIGALKRPWAMFSIRGPLPVSPFPAG
jgi:hypothetical protein